MNRILLCFVFMIVSLFSPAQVESCPYVSTSQTGGRFEIIQSPKFRRLTFKLDKYTGDVFLLVKNEEEELLWSKCLNVELDLLKIFLPKKNEENISYQLFMGGMAISDCFLLNIHNGDTYRLYKDSESEELYFSLMRNPSIEKMNEEKADDEPVEDNKNE